jgi:hypothetical protein
MIGIDQLFAVRILAGIQMSAHLFGATGDNILQCPLVAGQYLGTEAIDVVRSIAAEYVRQLDHGALKIAHQLIDGFDGHGLCFCSQMCVDTGSGRATMAQPSLDQPKVDAGFQKMRRP